MAALAIAGCGGGGSTRARVTVSPAASVEDQAIRIVVRGLSPHELVRLRLVSTDASGVRWVSTARFSASASGIVDPGRSGPRAGAYTGVWPMGLLSMMHPLGSTSAMAYSWAGHRPMRFTLSVKAGSRTLASTYFSRRVFTAALITRFLSPRETGFAGRFVYPPGARRRPAVVLVGGSRGGFPDAVSGEILAAHGYPVLELAYFKAPGLPQRLARIPLEYFERAFRWLRRQPQASPARLAMVGISFGTEATLLSGAEFPGLVKAVIALDPSDVAHCSLPACNGPAWTIRGHAVPYTSELGYPYPTDQPKAVIPVQRIRGPVFLACGTADVVWPSCPYGHKIMSRLDGAHDRFRHVLYAYPGAGHSIGTFAPYDPANPTVFTEHHGQADQQARARDWPRLLHFLAELGHGR